MQTIRTNVLATTMLAVILFPAIAHAARDVRDIIFQLIAILDTAVPVIVALALLYFFWGLGLFIVRADSEDERKKGKTIMVWGTIAIFVMFSIFGIVQILLNTFFGSFT